LAALAFALVAVAPLVSGARAQGKDDLSVSVVFGWQGRLAADRWSPITVSIAPGEKALAGVLTAEYRQDASGVAQTEVPFAATPGRTTPVHILACISESCDRVRLTLADEAGVVRWSQTFEGLGPGFAQPLPQLMGEANPLTAVVGRSSLFEALRDWPTVVASSDFTNGADRLPRGVTSIQVGQFDSAWTRMVPARAEAANLPTSWAAYDGLAMLVVIPDSSEPPDGRAVEAIHQWVRSGGRLVVRADAPGEAWRAWVPEAMTAGLEVEAMRQGPVPEEASESLQRLGSRLRVIQNAPAADSGRGFSGADAPIPVAASTLLQRPLRLVAGDGMWSLHWSTGTGSGLIAKGRLGFGTILVFGFDPAKTTTAVSTIGGGAVWREGLELAAEDVLDAQTQYYARRGWGSVSMAIQSAVNAALERVGQVPGVGDGAFILIAGCLLVLGLLVGPFDFFVLRRLRALQRSWMTAMAWTLAASIGAFAGPRLVRTDTTRINRLTIEDCIASPVGGEGETAVRALGGPCAFQSGVMGIYAGGSGIAKFPEADPASWWRGASVKYVNETTVPGSGVIPVVQRAAGGASGSVKGGPLKELPLALWTFRSFADEAAPGPTISARVRAGESGWNVLISGVPEGARVVDAALRVGKHWCTIGQSERVRDEAGVAQFAYDTRGTAKEQVGSRDGGVWTAMFARRFADKATPVTWSTSDIADSYMGTQETIVDGRPGLLTRLAGPSRRTQAVEEMIEGGKWAALYLEVAGWPLDTPIDWKLESEHTRILRVLVPLQGE